ncbi:unnamed protein product [Somion occarium]|uniref:Uncharacterized protein n=1 Tax=Somion occarium TaxID=3059160 RepID=A0ABP1DAX7_9APHY
MRLSTLIGGSFLSLALPFMAASQPAHGNAHARRHNEIAQRARGDVSSHLYKRFSGIRFTFYDVGLGACGKWNQPDDFIVALSAINWGDGYPGPQCFKSITISYGGKTAQATIMDECMGCPDHGLDFSRGLFNHFASEDAGVITGEWWFNDGSGGGEAPPPPKPTPSSTPPPPPPPETTSTFSSSWSEPPPPPPTTSSTPSTSSTPTSTSHSTSSSSSSVKPSSTSSSVIPTPTPTGPNNLSVINQAVIGLGALAVAGGVAAAN